MKDPFAQWELEPRLIRLCNTGLREIQEIHDDQRPYHNSGHALDVAIAAYDNGTILGYDRRQLGLAVFAAVYRDYCQDEETEMDNELISSEVAARTLSRAGGFIVGECEFVAELIVGTFAKIDEGKLLQPNARTIDQKALASADVCSFGMPPIEFRERADNLFLEENPGKELDSPEYEKYAEQKVSILKNYRFVFTPTERFYPYRVNNLNMMLGYLGRFDEFEPLD